MKQKAFTLAEVLITLMIIGILAMVTLPSLMKAWEKRALQTELKQTYSELLQVNQLFIAQEGMNMYEYADAVNNTGTYSGGPHPGMLVNEFRNYFRMISLKSRDYGGTYSGYLARDNYKTLKGNAVDYSQFDDGYFKDNRGRDWFFDYSPLVASIDLNGLEKAPNTWGYDIFTFDINIDGSISPRKDINTNYCTYSSSASTNRNGKGCAYYAVKNISPSDSTKTYWNDFLK